MEKDLNYWKNNAEEDYMKVPISVLRYITELEKIVLPQADVSGRSELLFAFGNFIASDTANLNYTPSEWVEMFLASNSH